MKKGDIVVNPYVGKDYDGKLNPNYASIYIGNNQTVDYKGGIHTWASEVDDWKVIGHSDLFSFIEQQIRLAVMEE